MRYFFLLLIFASLLPSQGYSLPRYSLEEKIRCYECHFNKKGGGPLSDRGRFYSQNRTLKGFGEGVTKIVEVAKREKKAPPKVIPTPAPPVELKPEVMVATKKEASLFERTGLSANMILSFIVNEDKRGPNDFFLMKAEPLVTTQVTDSFHTVFGYNFAAPVLTAYGQFKSENAYIQLGSFHLPFGLDTLDHNNVVSTLVKENYDLTLDTRDIGVEMGYERDWFLRAAVVNGGREPRERPTLLPTFDRNLGYVINGGYQGIFFEVPFLLGTSVLYERRVPPGNVVRGKPPTPGARDPKGTAILNLYGQLSAGGFSLLGEFAYGRHTPFFGDRSFGFYLRPSYNLTDTWSLAFRGELFARDRLFLKDSWLRFVISSEYFFSKYASIEPMLRLNYESGVVKDVDDHELITLVHMKF